MKFSKLVETVSKKPLPSWTKHLLVEVMVSDAEGEDVEVCCFSFFNSMEADWLFVLDSVHCHPRLEICTTKRAGD